MRNYRRCRARLGAANFPDLRAGRRVHFSPALEPLEERRLLSAVYWTVVSSLSSIQATIPDQALYFRGITGTTQVRNQNGAAWTTNNAKITGTLATDYVDFSTIQFLAGASSLNAIQTGSYRPNFSVFDDTSNT